jgi:sugar/nucleoside kinase (ribokinase family)
LFRKARSLGVTTSLDPNPDPADRYDSGLRRALAEADFFLPNELEAQRATGADSLDAALDRLPDICRATVVKAGASGAWYVARGERVHAAAKAVRVIDPTGAGDSFDAGFLWARLRPLGVAQGLEAGAQSAALACSAAGGTTAFADRRKLATLRQQLKQLR